MAALPVAALAGPAGARTQSTANPSEVAFQANTGILWVYDTKTGAGPSGLGMWITSSPAAAG